jgi:hypothetical protein
MEGLTRYQIYFLTRSGEILRMFELDCARDQDAVQKATHIRGADEVEIEVWEQTRFVYWLPVPPDTSQKLVRLMTLIVASVALAALGTTLIKWCVEALS